MVIFVCFTTRAVHLDVSSDYTVEAFLAALRRFISQSKIPQVIYSDCGTNFVGAEAELRAMFTETNQEAQTIRRTLAKEGVR